MSGGSGVESGGAGSRGASPSSSSGGSSSGWRRVGDSIVYNEEEVIGVGSSGTYVFRGYVQHTTRARHAVAVKRIQRPPGEEGRELLKLVEREVELLTALNQSPRVPFFHCWGITSSHVFIALELCTESLREHVARRGASMPVERRMEILRSVAAGIAWLHDPNKPSGCITHNDLKPENLLVDRRRRGEDRRRRARGAASGWSRRRVHHEHVPQIRHRHRPRRSRAGDAQTPPAHPAADIWAMGVVFISCSRAARRPSANPGATFPPTPPSSTAGTTFRRSCTCPVCDLDARSSPGICSRRCSRRPRGSPGCRFGHLAPALLGRRTDDGQSHRASRAIRVVAARSRRDALRRRHGSAPRRRRRGKLRTRRAVDRGDDGPHRLETNGRRRHLDASHHRARAPRIRHGRGRPKTDVGRKPYGDGFADLLRFCRNAYEHPPTGDEVEPIVATLAAAERRDERGDDGETDTTDGARSYALLPPGVVPGGAHRRLARRERRALFAAYVAHLFPGLPLAVYEVHAAIGPDVARGARKGGEEMRKRGGRRGGGHGAGAGHAAAAETATRTSNR